MKIFAFALTCSLLMGLGSTAEAGPSFGVRGVIKTKTVLLTDSGRRLIADLPAQVQELMIQKATMEVEFNERMQVFGSKQRELYEKLETDLENAIQTFPVPTQKQIGEIYEDLVASFEVRED